MRLYSFPFVGVLLCWLVNCLLGCICPWCREVFVVDCYERMACSGYGSLGQGGSAREVRFGRTFGISRRVPYSAYV